MNKQTIITALLALVVLAFASCGSDEPQWADPEAHETSLNGLIRRHTKRRSNCKNNMGH